MEDTSEVESNYTTVCKSFEDMCLQENLLRGIFAYGFEKPSAIQQRAIVPTIEGRDVIAQAQSGTGKTATFSIGLLQKIDTTLPCCQALVLAPTRELAKQIQKVVLALGDYMDVSCHVCIGGTQVNADIEKLRAGQHVLVGTPGRVLDLLNRGVLQSDKIRIFVLDEADEMLSLGFKGQIQEIVGAMPNSVQVILLSATMPSEVLEVTKNFMRNPVRILVKQEELTLEGICQFYVNVEREEWKLDTLWDIYQSMPVVQSVIFCNTRRTVDRLSIELINRDFIVSSLVSSNCFIRFLSSALNSPPPPLSNLCISFECLYGPLQFYDLLLSHKLFEYYYFSLIHRSWAKAFKRETTVC
ncbi:unnamed protein product [Schistocephalus solidus]|uniref:RNA helicase n=1 Tax=Schistocephalus solidus TaxID=70667 RepID=A0A183TF05_SCHSO|nr:unnamed protein product [Schistocephalus solidus]